MMSSSRASTSKWPLVPLTTSVFRTSEFSALLGLALCAISYRYLHQSRSVRDDTDRALDEGYALFYGVPGVAALVLSGAAIAIHSTHPKWALSTAGLGIIVALAPLVMMISFRLLVWVLDGV